MKIEYAKTIDAKKLAEIDKVANAELSGWKPNNKSDFMKIIKKNKNSIIVARENNNVVGYLSSRPDKDSKWLWVEDVYVLKNYRRKNVSKKLISKLVDYHKKKIPKRRIVLLTPDRNINIFRKLGFQKTMNFMEYKR